MDKKQVQIVTEIGAFGGLNIEDPTIVNVDTEDVDLDKIVKEALEKDA